MLARRLTTILPALTLAEAIETTRIHHVVGLTGDRTALITIRPLRPPHHTISDAGAIGGGHVPMPGGVSLAHHGVLFPDELPEFHRHVQEVLRQPIEIGRLKMEREWLNKKVAPYNPGKARDACVWASRAQPAAPVWVARAESCEPVLCASAGDCRELAPQAIH
jgi:hypothetical protein